MPTDQAECKRRALADKRPPGTLRLIDAWFRSNR